MTTQEPRSATAGERSTRERWLSALCYLGPLVFWPMLGERRRSAWLAQHVREGFALFAAEVAAWPPRQSRTSESGQTQFPWHNSTADTTDG